MTKVEIVDFAADDEPETQGEALLDKPKVLFIPEGRYELMLDYYETAFMFQGKSPKLVLHFKIMDHGPYFGKEVTRFYNVTRIIGKPGKHGSFKPALRSDFVYELMTLFNWQPTGKRCDRIPMSMFKGQVISGQVVTVKKDFKGRKMPAPLHYSKVGKLIAVQKPP